MVVMPPIGSLEVIVKLIVKYLPQIADVLKMIAMGLNLMQDENVKTFGDKAIQAEKEGIVPENFEDYKEYVEAIQKFELDDELSHEIDDNEKYSKAIETIVGVVDSVYPEIGLNKLLNALVDNEGLYDFMTSRRFSELTKIVDINPEFVRILVDFLSGKDLGKDDYLYIIKTLARVENIINPQLTYDDCVVHVKSLV